MKKLESEINAALGKKKADIVIKNAKILNVFSEELEEADLAICKDTIVGIGDYQGKKEIDAAGKFVVPSFIDGHMHLESSIVSPYEYSKAVVPHGTGAVVADPHEIANVCGTRGIDYILQCSENLPMDIYIMCPSCVPATPFDENGYSIGHEEIAEYLKKERVIGLAEFMNFPGVFTCDEEALEKIEAARKCGKIIDGHAPGLNAYEINAYTTAGIYSDHECTNAKEAIDKLKRGQWIMIREGTACKNLQSLLPLFEDKYYGRCLLVTDDKHPGELAKEGHIDHIIRKAIASGAPVLNAYTMATYNAARYFGLNRSGAIAPGYKADFLVLDNLENVDVELVFKDGCMVYDKSGNNGPVKTFLKPYIESSLEETVRGTVKINQVEAKDFVIEKAEERVIGLVEGEILTTDVGYAERVNVEEDILKLAVVERHHYTGHIGKCYIKGYGLKSGAVATTVSHDSHNIIVVGTNDRDMAYAVMQLKAMQGGMIVVENQEVRACLELPIAGLMSDLDVYETQQRMDMLKSEAHKLGVSQGIDPLMTLSFASLPVIPKLRLTTKGVVEL